MKRFFFTHLNPLIITFNCRKFQLQIFYGIKDKIIDTFSRVDKLVILMSIWLFYHALIYFYLKKMNLIVFESEFLFLFWKWKMKRAIGWSILVFVPQHDKIIKAIY